MSKVRLATAADVDAATRTLTEAFVDYPWTRHTIAADDHERRLETFQSLFITRIGLPHGKVWVTDDRTAVAVWTTPESTEIGAVFAELAPRFAELAGQRAAESQRAEAAMAAHRPTEPVWFLGTVGVHPDHQGKRLSSAVIQPGLDAAEEAGVPAYLETSTERNVRLYQRLGFTVRAEVELPDGGPRTWAMVREPRR
ncbi:acetyltransferase (GNAT) family protein [Tamaricihabitans halophyticus]|uniref:Acetyltransferase (GNAT) family protein n=1 Tax=Tamaricihabitans halophyticus TaxID=1262583 RepID=A0A4R2R162_9PSEU|nr:GNAT family N-acetyltransferase [Tamaricihabitans halophyticus]TCP56410.1 acetyltransferase (GNAT) family protein [Tamaricihabitans halophyticus]